MKRILSTILAGVLAIAVPISTFAGEPEGARESANPTCEIIEMRDATPEELAGNPHAYKLLEEDLRLRGTSKPTKGWNMVANGTYYVDGSSKDGKTLYTEYYFYQQTGYEVKTTNSGNHTITAALVNKTTGKTVGSVQVAAGKTGTFNCNGLGYKDMYDVKYTITGFNKIDVSGHVA